MKHDIEAILCQEVGDECQAGNGGCVGQVGVALSSLQSQSLVSRRFLAGCLLSLCIHQQCRGAAGLEGKAAPCEKKVLAGWLVSYADLSANPLWIFKDTDEHDAQQ